MGLINKDILNIINRIVYKHHINIINRYYSGIIVNRPNDSIALRLHNMLIALNWRHLNKHPHKYIYNFKNTITQQLPTLYGSY